MSEIVVLDAGPLGLLCAPPNRKGQARDCARWLANLLSREARVIVPEIADYEVRRELIRAGLTASICRLDALNETLEYLPLLTQSMRRAARVWAYARQTGQPTAGDNTIDADVILAAQVLELDLPEATVATTNVGHLSRFVAAALWFNIQ